MTDNSPRQRIATPEQWADLKRRGFVLHKIHAWGPYSYIVLDTITLQQGPQRIAVYDITTRMESAVLVDARHYPDPDDSDAEILAACRVAVLEPDEGETQLAVHQTDYIDSVNIYMGDLLVEVAPVKDRAAWQRLHEQQMDEYEESVEGAAQHAGATSVPHQSYTTDAVAEALGISQDRVRRLATARGVGQQVLGRWWFSAGDIDAMRVRVPGRPRVNGGA